MVRDSVQLETAVNTISHEYLLEFTSEYGISEMLHPELPGPGDRIVDFPEGKGIIRYTCPSCQLYARPKLATLRSTVAWVDECVFPTAVEWRTNASKDGMPANGTYFMEAVRVLDTHRTPIQKQLEMLLCLVEMDLFSLIRAPNPTKLKTGSRPRAPHELPLLTLTAPRVIEMDEPAAATDSSGVPSARERSSQGVDVAEDPGSKNASSPTEVGSPGKTKRAAEGKNAEPMRELEDVRAQFSDLKQVSGEEKLKAAFEEFKRYEDDRVKQRCAELDARLNALSIDFDEELYPHMLTAIAGRMWVIGHGLRLAMMKCAESLE
nr:hypothetical protein [Tanacetum cinerariifolium]